MSKLPEKSGQIVQMGNPRWVVLSVKRPLLWSRSSDEVWALIPPRRYVMSVDQLPWLEDHIESLSDLKSSANYRPLQVTDILAEKRILIDRYRDRGIGDYLFLSGPINYLSHVSGGRVQTYLYGLADRAAAFAHNPALYHKSAFLGPVEYDQLPLYHRHWFIETVTEFNEEPDQLNVYDVLYKELGLDPSNIDPRFKRPTVGFDRPDQEVLDKFFFMVHKDRKIDLRSRPYYVIAPFSRGSLRSMPYDTWLELIQVLAEKHTVIVLGQMTDRMPTTAGMSAMDFYSNVLHLQQTQTNIISMIGEVSVRLCLMIIKAARAAVCLDSGLLYMAQACRTPAVSLWGPHDPFVRIGYDPQYMALAIHNKAYCRHAPCFAYGSFPDHKCPDGKLQQSCECLSGVTAAQIMEKLSSANEQ